MRDHYVLDGHTPVPADDMTAWARWMARGIDARRVAATTVGHFLVSTVFLGIDHAFALDDHTPLLFETMVFRADGSSLDYQKRYPDWDSAEAGHQTAVAWASGSAG